MNKALAVFMLFLLPGLAMAANSHGHSQDEHETHHSEHSSHHHEAAHGVGQPGKAAEVSRTIEVDMSDNMRFSPDNIDVQAGETIRFVVTNSGQLVHELVIGDMDSLLAHAKEMRDMPDMVHEDPNMISLQPGKQGELLWKFTDAGNIDFACLLPGHMEAGMKGQVQVK